MSKASRVVAWVILASVLVVIVVAILLTIKISINGQQEAYYEIVNSPPTYSQVKNDAKDILVADDVEVISCKQNGADIIYTVEIPIKNSAFCQMWLVKYKLVLKQAENFGFYKWEYYSSRYLNTSER